MGPLGWTVAIFVVLIAALVLSGPARLWWYRRRWRNSR